MSCDGRYKVRFLDVRRYLSAMRSRDDGVITSQEEFTSFKLRWYRYALELPTGLHWVAIRGCLLTGLRGRANLGGVLIADSARNTVRGLGTGGSSREIIPLQVFVILYTSQDFPSFNRFRLNVGIMHFGMDVLYLHGTLQHEFPHEN